jgi:hypothetical protein
MSLEFRPMLAGDAVLLALQPSQHFELGVEQSSFTMDEGHFLAAGGHAWTAHRGSRIVAVAGFRQVYDGHAVVWAAIGADIGTDHLAVTRFARRQIEDAPYRRLEAVIDAANHRALSWARLVGLDPAHVLHGYGNAGTTHILFERLASAW